jgi:microcin C transport system ATP-binding protein
MKSGNGQTASPQGKLISVEDLSVDFRGGGNLTHAVRHVSFDIGDAETVALVGESGSGKTVTALSILRLLPYPAASHPAKSCSKARTC